MGVNRECHGLQESAHLEGQGSFTDELGNAPTHRDQDTMTAPAYHTQLIEARDSVDDRAAMAARLEAFREREADACPHLLIEPGSAVPDAEASVPEIDAAGLTTPGSDIPCAAFLLGLADIDGQTELCLLQTGIPDSADGRVFGHLNCRSCWVWAATYPRLQAPPRWPAAAIASSLRC